VPLDFSQSIPFLFFPQSFFIFIYPGRGVSMYSDAALGWTVGRGLRNEARSRLF
jgi:hypothetical protein